MSDKRLVRITIVKPDRCKPKKCGQECKKNCPVIKTGGHCVKKCPSGTIQIINLPTDLDKDTTHRYGPNTFKLHILPVPRPGQVLGRMGTNGIGKSTALKILAGNLKPNLGRLNVGKMSIQSGMPCRYTRIAFRLTNEENKSSKDFLIRKAYVSQVCCKEHQYFLEGEGPKAHVDSQVVKSAHKDKRRRKQIKRWISYPLLRR